MTERPKVTLLTIQVYVAAEDPKDPKVGNVIVGLTRMPDVFQVNQLATALVKDPRSTMPKADPSFY